MKLLNVSRTAPTIKLQSLTHLRRGLYGKGMNDMDPVRHYFLHIITRKGFKPHFSPTEADHLFKKEILIYGGNRYMPEGADLLKNLNSLENWKELLNNKIPPFKIFYRYCAGPESVREPVETDDIMEFKASMRQLKIIEDFIYHHRKEIWRRLPLAKGYLPGPPKNLLEA